MHRGQSNLRKTSVSGDRLRAIGGVAIAAAMLAAAPASAIEITVQNDSVADFGQAAIQAGFAAGEQAAAWLTSPCGGDIVAVQIYWRSVNGNAPQIAGDAITISAAGAFPVPGSQLELLPAPLMTDAFLNEFRYLDEGQQLPLSIPVDQGDVFVVSFRFDQAPGGSGPSVVTDVNGCQAGKNGIFAIPPSQWFSSCLFGVSGDFVIRAVVDCPPLIFEDGFEDGNFLAWSSVEP